MKEVKLQPIRDTPEQYEALERVILKALLSDIYRPIMSTLSVRHITTNSLFSVLDAIVYGDIQYVAGGFVGDFSSKISKELSAQGAKWDRLSKSWKIDLSGLNVNIREAILIARSREEMLRHKVLSQLDTIAEAKVKLDTASLFKRVEADVKRQFEEKARGLLISPRLSSEAKKQISEKYSDNLNLYIKDFKAKQVASLRKQVEQHVFAGNRNKSLAKELKASYGVTERKAKFLARQETQLLVAQLKETRYKDAGVDEYEWQCVKGTAAHPVRHMHEQLNGKRFRFSAPPITNPQGEHNNPGTDYNCRCAARPIIKF